MSIHQMFDYRNEDGLCRYHGLVLDELGVPDKLETIAQRLSAERANSAIASSSALFEPFPKDVGLPSVCSDLIRVAGTLSELAYLIPSSGPNGSELPFLKRKDMMSALSNAITCYEKVFPEDTPQKEQDLKTLETARDHLLLKFPPDFAKTFPSDLADALKGTKISKPMQYAGKELRFEIKVPLDNSIENAYQHRDVVVDAPEKSGVENPGRRGLTVHARCASDSPIGILLTRMAAEQAKFAAAGCYR